jgi:hypothetical protein
MVAYSFNKRFAGPIQRGIKTQTIRPPRKRHARPGEAVSLFCGMRTRECFRIVPDPTCTEVLHVELMPMRNRIVLHTGRDEVGAMRAIYTIHGPLSLDRFAILDGFSDWAEMKAFWLVTYPEASDPELYWDDILINWGVPYLSQVAT